MAHLLFAGLFQFRFFLAKVGSGRGFLSRFRVLSTFMPKREQIDRIRCIASRPSLVAAPAPTRRGDARRHRGLTSQLAKEKTARPCVEFRLSVSLVLCEHIHLAFTLGLAAPKRPGLFVVFANE